MKNHKDITREEFMMFFRNDEKLNELTPSDRDEIFRTILLGSSDITKSLLDGVLSDYGVCGLDVVEAESGAE